MKIIFVIIIFFISQIFTAFAFSMIISCLFSGLPLIKKYIPNKSTRIKMYFGYLASVLFWILIWSGITLLVSKTIFANAWFTGNIIGGLFSLQTLSKKSQENNKFEFLSNHRNQL